MKLKERNSKNKPACARPSVAGAQTKKPLWWRASESTEWVAVKEMSGFPCAPQQQQATSHAPNTHTHTSIPPRSAMTKSYCVSLASAHPPACRFVRRTVRKLIIISICDLFINTDPSAALAAAQKTPQFIVSVHAALLQKLTPPRCALLYVRRRHHRSTKSATPHLALEVPRIHFGRFLHASVIFM